MKLKCVAKISSVYWQSNEESVESDKHQRIPVLESRETVIPKSRHLEKSQPLEEKHLKKSRRPAAATSVASAAAAAAEAAAGTAAASSASSSSCGSSVPWSRILASKSIARISLYALPVLIAFLCTSWTSSIPAKWSSCQSQQRHRRRRLSTQLVLSTVSYR